MAESLEQLPLYQDIQPRRPALRNTLAAAGLSIALSLAPMASEPDQTANTPHYMLDQCEPEGVSDEHIEDVQLAALLRDASTVEENRDSSDEEVERKVIDYSQFPRVQTVNLPRIGLSLNLLSDDEQLRVDGSLLDALLWHSIEQFGKDHEPGSLPAQWAACALQLAQDGLFATHARELVIPGRRQGGVCLEGGKFVTPDSKCPVTGRHIPDGIHSTILLAQRSHNKARSHNRMLVHELVHLLDRVMRDYGRNYPDSVLLDASHCADLQPADLQEFCLNNLLIEPAKFIEFLGYEVADRIKSHQLATVPVIGSVDEGFRFEDSRVLTRERWLAGWALAS